MAGLLSLVVTLVLGVVYPGDYVMYTVEVTYSGATSIREGYIDMTYQTNQFNVADGSEPIISLYQPRPRTLSALQSYNKRCERLTESVVRCPLPGRQSNTEGKIAGNTPETYYVYASTPEDFTAGEYTASFTVSGIEVDGALESSEGAEAMTVYAGEAPPVEEARAYVQGIFPDFRFRTLPATIHDFQNEFEEELAKSLLVPRERIHVVEALRNGPTQLEIVFLPPNEAYNNSAAHAMDPSQDLVESFIEQSSTPYSALRLDSSSSNKWGRLIKDTDVIRQRCPPLPTGNLQDSCRPPAESSSSIVHPAFIIGVVGGSLIGFVIIVSIIFAKLRQERKRREHEAAEEDAELL